MADHKTKSISEFVELSLKLSAGGQKLFRGHADEQWPLIPAVVRKIYAANAEKPDSVFDRERYMFDLFRDRAIAYLRHRPGSLLEWMAIAQHAGLPTRLLDWSFSPLVALYFAVAGPGKADMCVHVMDIPSVDCRDNDRVQNNPFEVDQNYLVAPPHVNERIPAQHGVFTLHPDPRQPIQGQNMHKIVIPADARFYMGKDLHFLGVNAATIYPGLDGIAESLRFLHLGPIIS